MIASPNSLPRVRGFRATNSLEATTSRVSLEEVGLQNEEEHTDRNLLPDSREDNEDSEKYFGDLPGRFKRVRLE